jgi:antitoxin (DNA-binding transcriptional repressor) of toxin-antitoxin stability system
MPSITLSQLRDTKRLLAWLRAGKTVELRDRNRVIAHIVPVERKRVLQLQIKRFLEDDERRAKLAKAQGMKAS